MRCTQPSEPPDREGSLVARSPGRITEGGRLSKGKLSNGSHRARCRLEGGVTIRPLSGGTSSQSAALSHRIMSVISKTRVGRFEANAVPKDA